MATRILPFTTLVLTVLALTMIQNGDGAVVTLPGGAVATLPGGAPVTVPGAAVTLPGKVTVPGGAVTVVTIPGGAMPGGGATGTGTTSKSAHNAAIISRSSFTMLVGAVALAVLAP